MELFENPYKDVKYVEIFRKSRKIKMYVVVYGEQDWAGAIYKNKVDAYRFSDYLRSRNGKI